MGLVRLRLGSTLTVLAILGAAAFGAARQSTSDFQPEFESVLVHDLSFSTGDLEGLEHGKIVKRTLTALEVDELGVAGAIRVQGPRDRLIAAYRDIVAFRKGAGVLEIGRFSVPPEPSDLDALTTDHDDFDLRGCKVGDCDIRLPASEIQRIAASVDWRRTDADARATGLFKQLLFDHVQSYASGGPGRMTQYDDGRTPILPVAAGEELIRTSAYLDKLKPGLAAHLVCAWSNPLDGAEDLLYWSKEKFAIAPFISVTHVTIVPSGPHQSLATSRDVYSSRYIDGSLSTMIASDAVGDPGTFYLVYVNRSRASALRGPMAGLKRSIIEHKARGSLDTNLRDIKARIEALRHDPS
jgi:hypothetical protein